MDLRTLTKLLLKLAGLYLLLTALVAFPSVINLPKPYNVESAIFVGIYCALGAVLLWLPGGFINTIIRVPRSQVEGAITARKLLQVGCILLGVYFALTGAFSFIYTYAQARWFYDVVRPFGNSRGPDINPNDFAQLMTNGVKFVVGLCFWFGSRYVVKATGAFRDDG
jgi:hypothetical protein